MINRVTHTTIQRSTLQNIQVNLTRMAELQGQLSSGKKINVPSDNPGAASDAMRLRADQRAAEQYARNADNGNSWLTMVDTALQTSLASVRQARDLTIQGGNGANGATSREALAVEVEGIRDALLEQANTTYLGRSVFAGTSNAGVAFEAGSYEWTGTSAGTVERRLAEQVTVRVDSDGGKVFGDGPDSVFALMDKIASDLRDPNADPTQNIAALDERLNALLTEVSGVGARHKQVQNAQTQILEKTQMAKSELSAVEDIDLAATLIELQVQEVAYKAALGAGAKVLQPTLLDFLR